MIQTLFSNGIFNEILLEITTYNIFINQTIFQHVSNLIWIF